MRNPLVGVFVAVAVVTMCSWSSNGNTMRDALTAFKQAISNDPLHALASWDVSNQSSNPCSWAGLLCNDQQYLTTIDLSSKSLQGSISGPALSLLTNLSHLNLSFNAFSSSFPTSLPPSLSYLDLSYNTLSGTLPLPSIANLSSLQYLLLHYNFLSGPLTLPPSCFPNLLVLSIARNSFYDSVPPSLSLCTSLISFNASHNLFTGILFPAGLVNLTFLREFDVGVNNLNGPIPPGLGNSSDLQFLSLPINNISGSIPPSIGLGCRKLSFLSLYQNNGSGAFPTEMGLLSNLNYLSIGLNSFSGDVLHILANCSALGLINLQRNAFTGQVPPDLGSRLPSLTTLILSSNMFTGSIPASLGNCSGLGLLFLDILNISGTIPEEVFRCQQITQLDFAHNFLSGIIPLQIGNLTSMQKLYLNNNQFKGSLPQELGLLASMQLIILDYNLLSGNIPIQLFNCTAILRLSLDNNLLYGPVSSSIGNLATHLANFSARSNMLMGPLPPGLSNCTKLEFLSLSNNLLDGEIQSSVIAPLLASIHFDLSDNNLSGSIPPEFGVMIHLVTLDLSYNKLSGPVPSGLGGCVGLLSLNLSQNHLDGVIPSSLGTSLLSLLTLNLSHNFINGSIPTEVGNLTSLQQLDLSSNALSGTIPSILADMRALVFLNLSYNSLEGTVPSGGVFSNLTFASFLGNPRLCGHIVNRICTNGSSSHALTKPEKIGLAVAVASVVLLLIVGSGCLIFLALCRRKRSENSERILEWWDFSPFLRLKLEEIQRATNNFSEQNIIGTGLTGTVYRGEMTKGAILAFKRFTLDNIAISSFSRELQSLRLIRHRNLVRILGYCSNQLDTNILILEYMPNGNLNDLLHPQDGGKCRLMWEVRRQVAMGIAQGLLYLHYECPTPVIHCDLKPHNILFDADMQVRITDFGLAKVMEATPTSSYSRNMQGTVGYIAPELASYGHISRKCDVYSYGILVMELVSGRRPSEEVQAGSYHITPVQWVESKFEADETVEIVDERLREEYEEHEMEMKLLLNVALQCTHENPRRRPTMQQVMQQLLNLHHT